MNYVFGWAGLVVVSMGVSLVAFAWALKNGQFAEQQRLRYLPLRGQPAAPSGADPARLPVEVYVLLAIGTCVVTVFLIALILSLFS